MSEIELGIISPDFGYFLLILPINCRTYARKVVAYFEEAMRLNHVKPSFLGIVRTLEDLDMVMTSIGARDEIEISREMRD